ncbi:microtubule-associated protein-like protein ytm1 [Viridothelium virens]|uniref:Ribosome biogenesis protein YTM1 n=1 Tax=Viridothelium virens TaxID=1048519 RepID=A0A6A6HHV1_VIRVR|nr:microtubule-associated protein-like protein ytm1 [Viridothelium virens]
MTDSTETTNQPSTQVSIQLSTRHKDVELPQDPGIIRIPTAFRRIALSKLVNSLLETKKPIPFEFLINGQFLRTTLDDFLTANGISAEEQLTVEYVRAITPPSQTSTLQHDDWVSSVDVLSATSQASKWAGGEGIHTGHERILTGSYDNFLRIWNMSRETIAISPSPSSGGHTDNINAAKFLSPTRLITSSLDRTIRIWKYTEDSSNPSSKASITPSLELYGHRSSVDSLALHAPTQRILSASQDTTIGLWSTSKRDAPPAPSSLLPSASLSLSSKRQKTNSAGNAPPASSSYAPQRGPLALLTAHTANASAVIFAPHDPALAHSTSWDHTLRTWDLPTARALSSTPLPASLLSLCALPGVGLLAAGSTARAISLVDSRAGGGSGSGSANLVAMTLRGHAGPVACLAAGPEEGAGGPWALVSGGFDGTCRVWDVRSVRAGRGSVEGGIGAVGEESVFVVGRESEKGTGRVPPADRTKVFGVCWDRDVGILSAGNDNRVQVDCVG